ncbi:MAG: DUF3500 domain-containing protein [Bryobacteraceae bacterium]|nr:DUF3500 domain-containing protein [Bryobacteraceae bacterium]
MLTVLGRTTLALAAAFVFVGAHSKVSSPVTMTEAAKTFLASLTPEQAAKATMDLKSDARLQWHFVPDNNFEQHYKAPRRGLTIRDMTPPQRHLAQALLASALSQRGYIKATSIMSLEDILRQLENDSGERRNPEKYYFSIFGTPEGKNPWALRVEGHHISLHFAIADGRVSAAPTFFGTNPAEVRQGPRKGLRVLAREEDLARDLLMALTPEQKKTAVVDPKAYPDILTTVKRSAALEGQPSGLHASKMTAKQREMLAALLAEYCANLPEEMEADRLAKIKKAGTNLHFAWAGVEERGGPHYYRVQAADFLVEYDNTQNGANHIHSVWRDMASDFGEDVLKAHYAQSHGK